MDLQQVFMQHVDPAGKSLQVLNTFRSCMVSSAMRPLLGTPMRRDVRLSSFRDGGAAKQAKIASPELVLQAEAVSSRQPLPVA